MARLARDRFIFGVTLAYVAGATLWIAPKEIATDPEALPAGFRRRRPIR